MGFLAYIRMKTKRFVKQKEEKTFSTRNEIVVLIREMSLLK